MPFTLDEVVPWGRSFDEYLSMFGLSDADLGGRILGCADGPASFNAELHHFEDTRSRRRYVAAALPTLPFASNAFDIALCSHFLFLYSEQRDQSFHVGSIIELQRIAAEVRVFPLLELGGARSRHLDAVELALSESGFAVEEVPVPYEFQRGGDHMLRIRR